MKNNQLAVGRPLANWTKNTRKGPLLSINETHCYLPTSQWSANRSKLDQCILNKINDLGDMRGWQKYRLAVGKPVLPTVCNPRLIWPVAILEVGCADPPPLQGVGSPTVSGEPTSCR